MVKGHSAMRSMLAWFMHQMMMLLVKIGSDGTNFVSKVKQKRP